MKFTSILLTFLSATVVTAYEHNAKSMLRGVDTKVHLTMPPTICRKNNDCDGSDVCDLTDTVLSFCSHYTTNAKPHCCVSPDEEDTLSKKAEATEKVAKVLPLLKDASKVKSDAMVKEDPPLVPSEPICAPCDDAKACPDGTICEVFDTQLCSFGCRSNPDPAPAQDFCNSVCDGVSCNGQKVCCPDRASGCTSDPGYTCTRASACSGLVAQDKEDEKE